MIRYVPIEWLASESNTKKASNNILLYNQQLIRNWDYWQDIHQFKLFNKRETEGTIVLEKSWSADHKVGHHALCYVPEFHMKPKEKINTHCPQNG